MVIGGLETYRSAYPGLGRTGTTDEIAKAVAFLACDESSYITGIELFVDGGQCQILRSSPPFGGLEGKTAVVTDGTPR